MFPCSPRPRKRGTLHGLRLMLTRMRGRGKPGYFHKVPSSFVILNYGGQAGTKKDNRDWELMSAGAIVQIQTSMIEKDL